MSFTRVHMIVSLILRKCDIWKIGSRENWRLHRNHERALSRTASSAVNWMSWFTVFWFRCHYCWASFASCTPWALLLSGHSYLLFLLSRKSFLLTFQVWFLSYLFQSHFLSFQMDFFFLSSSLTALLSWLTNKIGVEGVLCWPYLLY